MADRARTADGSGPRKEYMGVCSLGVLSRPVSQETHPATYNRRDLLFIISRARQPLLCLTGRNNTLFTGLSPLRRQSLPSLMPYAEFPPNVPLFSFLQPSLIA